MTKKIFYLIIFFLFLSGYSYSAGGDSAGSGDDDSIVKLKGPKERAFKIIKIAKKLEKKGKEKKAKKKYKKAFDLLIEYNNESPSEPEVLNYLGFTSRKIGNFEEAEVYYLIGLSIEPNHKGINEYLGELYLQTNRKDKAIERLKILEKCSCEEYTQLKDLIDGKSKSKY